MLNINQVTRSPNPNKFINATSNPAAKISFNRYEISILRLQCEHLPAFARYPKNGIKSAGLKDDLQLGQKDLGDKILIELLGCGSLYISIERKLPMQPPIKKKTKLMSNTSTYRAITSFLL